MGVKYDNEQFARDVEALLKAELNTKIGEINTEKADSITIGTVDDAAYVFQSMNDSIMNYDPWLFFGEEPPSTAEGIGPVTSRAINMDVVIVIQYGNDLDTGYKLLRYRRALREVFEENYDKINNRNKVTISDIGPIPFAGINEEHPMVAIGVQIKGSVA